MTKPNARCGACENCLKLEKIRERVLACCNPPFSHADQGVIDLWNAEVACRPCLSTGGLSPKLQAMQVAVYVMCGGGELGLLAATQPIGFWMDEENEITIYSAADVYAAVGMLAKAAKQEGHDVDDGLPCSTVLEALPYFEGILS